MVAACHGVNGGSSGVLMNVKNPDNSLLTSDPLPDIGRIVVVGSPQGGWTLTNWNGKPR